MYHSTVQPGYEPEQPRNIGPMSDYGYNSQVARAPLETPQEMFMRESQKAGGSFHTAGEAQNAIVRVTRDYANQNGIDIRSPEGAKWYQNELEHGYQYAQKYVSDPKAEKDYIREDQNGDYFDIRNGKVVYSPKRAQQSGQSGQPDVANTGNPPFASPNPSSNDFGQIPPPMPSPAPTKPKSLAEQTLEISGPGSRAGKAAMKQIEQDRVHAEKARRSQNTISVNDRNSFRKVAKDSEAEMATQGSSLGLAAVAKTKGERALQLLSNETNTPEELGLIEEDIAAIIKGGVPTDLGQKTAEYKNIYRSFAKLKEQITGEPEAVNTEGIRNRLKGVLSEMNALSNRIIENHYKIKGLEIKDVLDRNPELKDQWGDLIKARAEQMAYVPGSKKETSAPKTGSSNVIPTVTTKADFDALPSGVNAPYIGKNGKLHHKP
jgi:hypothetical protein